ncbi:MAG TPA: glycosyltransferase family 39 protein [Myxococcota bacterium]|nr:glycosyltransferase family 39 protein [Myxococcota bacterium]HRY91968.1 glycosyltransferase family 39 protein [Myxococcota bacterium]
MENPQQPPAGPPAAPPASATGRLAWLQGTRGWLLVAALGLALYLPWLGSTGLWDPWEPHYAEVAREMVVSGNWLEPTWEWSPGQSRDRKHFFSKPALTLWLLAAPMALAGVEPSPAGLRPGLEWLLRLPFALLAIAGLVFAFLLGRRFFGPRVGLLAAVILATCPQYYFIARQAMTDMPFVALLTGGMALLAGGGLDDRPRPGLLYTGYALLGLGVLAKGLLAALLPGLVFLLYFVISWDWARLARMRVWSGAALLIAVAAPWFVYLSLTSALQALQDDEGKTFFQRFFLHDHLYRLASGVHGDRGTFAYFIEQLGLGTHPWFPFMAWGAVRSARRLEGGGAALDRAGRVELLLWLWAVAGFALVALSVTKFHHYALPMVPALALLAALWLDRFARGEERPGRLTALALVLFVALISRDLGLLPKAFTDLFVYKYERPFPAAEALVGQIGFAALFGLMALGLAGLLLRGREQLRRLALPVLVAGALASAVWGGWYYFQAMGPHWSQRHLFDAYHALRAPDDPIGAYLMNWRGETFYSQNEVTQLKNNAGLKAWLAEHRDRRRFLLVEQARLEKLKEQLGPEQRKSLRVLDRTCNKFFLLSLEPEPPAPPPAPAGGAQG